MIPSAVTKIFEQYQNEPELAMDDKSKPSIVTKQGVPSRNIIKMILMSDTLGRAQVIFPADCMLDVDALNQSLGRTLVALPNEDVSSLTARYSLQELPAIPDITGLPAIIDTRVLENDEIYVEAGEPDKLIKLSKALFKVSIKKAQEAQFVVPVSSIPWQQTNTDADMEKINHAIEKFTSLRIKKRLEDTLELPPLPQSAQDIIKLRSDPDAGSDELATIVERDPSLSAQVVSWASSSFYNAPGKIKSVHDAIIRVLGFDMVMNLSMGLSLGRTLNLPGDEPEGYTPYWHQAMWVALGTTSLISKIEPAYRPGYGISYLTGLLHNFGYLILSHVFPPHFSLICRYIEANPHLDSAVIETFLLGITREQIGSQLMSVWNMPAEVITALRHQKNEDYEGANAEYANILTLAQELLAKHGVLKTPYLGINQTILDNFQLSEADADEAILALLKSQDDVSAMANSLNA